MDKAREAAERVARTSYGRLVALLAARSGDIAAAEDALSEAFRAALTSWGAHMSERPEAWLLTAARRSLGHQWRHDRVKQGARETLLMLEEEGAADADRPFTDARLGLLFACAHPGIDPAIRTPLMLQTILGLDAARIAAAFLVEPAAMGQRLVRAKAKIKLAGIAFAEPEGADLAPRLAAVLAAIYVAYGRAWDETPGAEQVDGLASEAIFLARMLVELMPDEPEPCGLLALLLYCEARSGSRRADDGRYVPLSEQDPIGWSRPMIGEAERLLTRASGAARLGRYQTEAAIQSFHVGSRITGHRDASQLLLLYDLLARTAPTIGVLVARAAVVGEAESAEAGLAALDAIGAAASAYQPNWAVRAHLLAKIGDRSAATAAYARAAMLSRDEGVRAYLRQRGEAAA